MSLKYSGSVTNSTRNTSARSTLSRDEKPDISATDVSYDNSVSIFIDCYNVFIFKSIQCLMKSLGLFRLEWSSSKNDRKRQHNS